MLGVLLSFGCGGDKERADRERDDGNAGGTSSAGTSNAGTSNAGMQNGGSAGAGGSAGSAAGSAAGGSGSGQAGSAGSSTTSGCTGAFGTPTLLFSGTDRAIPQSFSVTGDDLELYYQENRVETQHVFVRKRASRTESFGPAVELSASLFAWCPTPLTSPNVDVSDDGLRLYMTCTPDMSDTGAPFPAGPIRVAARPDRTSEFTLLPDSFGMAWISLSVSPDELTAVSMDLAVLERPRIMLSVRESRDAPFGAAVEVTGDAEPFRHPEFVGDSFTLFGAWEDLQTYAGRIAVRTRSTLEPTFGAPALAGVPRPAENPSVLISDLTPTLSADCRSVYFLRLTTTEQGDYLFDAYAATR